MPRQNEGGHLNKLFLKGRDIKFREVDSWLKNLTLEDDYIVKLHRPTATTRIWQCLNDLKRTVNY